MYIYRLCDVTPRDRRASASQTGTTGGAAQTPHADARIDVAHQKVTDLEFYPITHLFRLVDRWQVASTPGVARFDDVRISTTSSSRYVSRPWALHFRSMEFKRAAGNVYAREHSAGGTSLAPLSALTRSRTAAGRRVYQRALGSLTATGRPATGHRRATRLAIAYREILGRCKFSLDEPNLL
ncbi:hypothetical protein EVAR_26794_1 [Eumeta japonica]|uniref:Uncharacterized protein n=1 Tax=Eumeta variegata TaxID=151549 RepID=A0A4C1WCG0_EUMVA|nr:hypothetical protein EVAR_26794_1 [Eumeta japonica]